MRLIQHIIFLVLFTAVTYSACAQNNATMEIARKWKIAQMYADSIPVADTSVSVLRYTFLTNGNFILGNIVKGNLNLQWKWLSPSEFLIFNAEGELQKGKIIYLNASNLVFTTKSKSTANNTDRLVEYRMSPE